MLIALKTLQIVQLNLIVKFFGRHKQKVSLIYQINIFLKSIEIFRMSSTFALKRNHDNRRVSRKRCLSQLQQPRQKELFQTIFPPFQKYFNSLSLQNEYKGKIFRKNIQAYLQIFTYNYLVACFELKNSQNSSIHLDYIYELIQKPQFQFLLPERGSQLCSHTHMNLKNIISQFLNYLSSGINSIMKSLDKYPLVLQMFTAFFRTLLALGEVCTNYEQPLQMEQTFQFLTSYFDLEVIIGDRYLFFTETNIYVCQNSPDEVYMFIPNDQFDVSSFSQKRQQQLYKSGITTINYLITGFQQQSSANMRKSRHQKRKKQAQVVIQKIQDRRISIQKKFQVNQQQKDASNQKSIIHTIQFSKTLLDYSDSKKSKAEFTLSSVLDQHKKNTLETQSSQKNQHFKKQNKVLFQNRNIPNKEQKTQVKTHTHNRNKSQFDGLYESNKQNSQVVNQFVKTKKNSSTQNGKFTLKVKQKQRTAHEIQGCFYRPQHTKLSPKLQRENMRIWVSKDVTKQFTSSIILAQMPEPYRTNIKMKKERARQIRKSAYNMIK